jgi:hypothetical protein
MQQLSHQTLNSALALCSAFTAFIFPHSFILAVRLFLKTRDRSRAVVRLMFALFPRTSKYKLSGRHRLTFSCSLCAIEGEQDRHLALPAANAEIPAQICLGPLKNIHESRFL